MFGAAAGVDGVDAGAHALAAAYYTRVSEWWGERNVDEYGPG